MAYIQRFGLFGFIILSIYSITILIIEYKTSQEYVRYFLTDIEGPVPFYAINTTLSVLLLSFTALVFLINMFTIFDRKNHRKKIAFYFSQVLIFAYLALDDRFMLHEKMKSNLGFEGDIILAVIGIIEIALIFFLGKFRHQRTKHKLYIIAAGIFFAIMLSVDILLPSKAFLRLSIEDLSKTWSGFFLFLFAWSLLMHNLNYLKSEIGKERI